MTSRTHDVFSIAALVTIATYYPPTVITVPTLVFSSIGAILGSLLPDIDQSTNRLWDLLPAGEFIGKILNKLFLSHRTISHSLLGAYLINRLIFWMVFKVFNTDFLDANLIYYSVMIGYLSHMVLDLFTEEGLPLLFPLKIKFGIPPVKPWRIKTGKWFEKFVVYPGIIFYIIWFAVYNREKVFYLISAIKK